MRSLIKSPPWIKVNANTKLFSCIGRRSKQSEMKLLVEVWPLFTIQNCVRLHHGQGPDLSVVSVSDQFIALVFELRLRLHVHSQEGQILV